MDIIMYWSPTARWILRLITGRAFKVCLQAVDIGNAVFVETDFNKLKTVAVAVGFDSADNIGVKTCAVEDLVLAL